MKIPAFLAACIIVLAPVISSGSQRADTFLFPLDNYVPGANRLGTCGVVYDCPVRHLGEDAPATATTPVYSPANGVVKYSGYVGGYGGVVIIEHDTGTERVVSVLAHLDAKTITKKPGEEIARKELVGQVGTKAQNGNWNPHLHFGIRKGPYVSGPKYYYEDPKVLQWKWTWAYLGYSKYCNLTATTKTTFDVTHETMTSEWYSPSDFVRIHQPQTVSPFSLSNYSVVKFQTYPTCYVYFNGQLWPIRDEVTFALLGYNTGQCNRADFSYLVELPATDRDKYSPLVAGGSIVAQGVPVRIVNKVGPRTCSSRDAWRDAASVYLFDGLRFRPISSADVYFAIGYKKDWSDLADITQDVFNFCGEGTFITSVADVNWFAGGGSDRIIPPPFSLVGRERYPGEAYLEFELPSIYDVYEIRLYQDDKAVARTPATDAILVSGLTSGKTYKFQVSIVINGTNEESLLSNAVYVTIAYHMSQRYILILTTIPFDGGSITANPPPEADGKYASGIIVQLTANPNTLSGYRFSSWIGDALDSINPPQVTMNGNKSVTANFSANPLNYEIVVSASPSAGGSVSGGGTFTAGNSYTVSATANIGYTFINWTEGGNVVNSSANYMFTLNSDRMLVANFSVTPPCEKVDTIPYEEHFSSLGGFILETNNHHQGALTIDGESHLIISSTQAGEPYEVQAKKRGYEITQGVQYSHLIVAKADRPGLMCVVLQRDVSPWDELFFQPINLTTEWQTNIVSFTVTNAPPAPCDVRYAIQIGKTTGEVSVDRVEIAIANPVNYSITVSASPSAGGTVSGGGMFPAGSSPTVTASANSGYTFANWTAGGSVVSSSANYTFTLNSDRMLVANFSVTPPCEKVDTIPYEEHFSSLGGFILETNNHHQGALTIDGESHLIISSTQAGEPYEVQAKKRGYEITQGVQYSHLIVAKADRPGLMCVVLQRDVSPWDELFFQPINLTTEWQTNIVSFTVTNAPPAPCDVRYAIQIGKTTGEVSVDRVEIAIANPVNYSITVSASPSAGGTVSGGGMFPAGSSPTVTASANSGYTFANWTAGGSVVSSSANYTFTLNSDRMLVANFSVTPPCEKVDTIPYEEHFSSLGGFILETNNHHQGALTIDGESHLIISSTQAGEPYEVQAKKRGYEITQGVQYSHLIVAKADRPGLMCVVLQRDVSPWDELFFQPINLTTEWQTNIVSFTVTNAPPAPCDVRYAIQIGKTTGEVSVDRVEIAIANPVNYSITVSASPSAGGTVSGGGMFPAGSSPTVTASANSGYTFANWTAGGSVVSSSANYTFTLNSDRMLVANFSVTPPCEKVDTIPYEEHFSSLGGFILETNNHHQGALTIDGESHLIISSTQAGEPYEVQAKKRGYEITQGVQYSHLIVAKADRPGLMCVVLQRDVSPWDELFFQPINLTTEWQTNIVSFTVTNAPPAPCDVRYAIQIGKTTGEVSVDRVEIAIASEMPPCEIRLSGKMLAAGAFKLMVATAPGSIYFVETSDDLRFWSAWTNLLSTGRSLEVIDDTASHLPYRYYRVISR